MKKKIIPAKHLRDFKHPLVTRRDFLTHGVLAFGAMAAIPTFASRLPNWAKKIVDASSTPFMAFDMAGGGSMHGNFLVGKAGGPTDLLKSYDTLGWDPREQGSLNTDFGLPMSAKYSKILQGILTSASAGARANLRMGSFCHNVAEFDSDSNNLNSTILVYKSGSHGAYIGKGLGLLDSFSGGNSSAVQGAANYAPIVINNMGDLLHAVTFGGDATQNMPLNQVTALAQGGVDLNAAQNPDYINLPGGYTLATNATPAYGQTLALLNGVQGLDPRGDTLAPGIYNISTQTPDDDMNAIAAGLAMNTILGNCGPSTWTLGNCDYHTGAAADGDGQDLIIGTQIGLAVEYAFQAKKPFFFQIITDGSCSAEGGSRDWNADSFANMTIIGYFNPTAPPQYVMDGNNPRYQVGAFTDAQSPDTTTVVGNSPDRVTCAAFANYLNVCGRLDEFNNYAPGVFSDKELQSVLIFQGSTT